MASDQIDTTVPKSDYQGAKQPRNQNHRRKQQGDSGHGSAGSDKNSEAGEHHEHVGQIDLIAVTPESKQRAKYA